jgi:hypothetical protein
MARGRASCTMRASPGRPHRARPAGHRRVGRHRWHGGPPACSLLHHCPRAHGPWHAFVMTPPPRRWGQPRPRCENGARSTPPWRGVGLRSCLSNRRASEHAEEPRNRGRARGRSAPLGSPRVRPGAAAKRAESVFMIGNRQYDRRKNHPCQPYGRDWVFSPNNGLLIGGSGGLMIMSTLVGSGGGHG